MSTWSERRFPFESDSPVLWRDGPSPESPLLVLCHGMSQDPAGFAAMWPRLTSLPAHVVAPAGPYPHELREKGSIRIGHAWYLYDGGPDRFRETARRSADWVAGVLTSLEGERGWRPSRRILAGYSQGAYFGYLAALWHRDRVTDLVAVAGRLKEEFVRDALADPGSLRVLVVHGREDRAVPPEGSERSAATLRRAGIAVELALLPGGHDVLPEADRRAAAWVAAGEE
jgi:predicted esterase